MSGKPKRGIAYIAVGESALRESQVALQCLRNHSELPYKVITESPIPGESLVMQSRYIKTTLPHYIDFQQVLYMDADTRVYSDLSPIFAPLNAGFDFVITINKNQGQQLLWHIDPDEKAETINQLGLTPVGLQGGVFAYRNIKRVRQFFAVWHEEWLHYRGQDQGALLRALNRFPLRTWLMGVPFNDGSIISHLWGSIR